jgi:purine nucleosidase
VTLPLILDVDTGVDDAVALLLAAASPEVEIAAVTTVTGNVHVEKATRNTLLVLELAGLADVDVSPGADRPLDQPWQPFPVVHGEEGLGAYQPGTPSRTASGQPAHEAIVELARARPGELHLVATGPLTNVALAVELEPALPEMLRGFTLMGGAFREGGNVSPRAEANVWMDPEAADRVFRAWSGAAPAQLPRCVGLDVTERVVLTTEHLDEICSPAPDSPLARLLRESVEHYISFYASTERFDGACMHDPLAVAVVIDPTLCEWASTRVEVELEGRWTRGETVTDLYGVRRSPWSDWEPEDDAVVATSVDAGRVASMLVERLRTLVEGRA